uniref:ATP synthase subunit a n=1 Tax=Sminthurinus signatus TaxID=2584529 RepID=A0A6H0EXQ2_9HEXA|nr:ATP synthase F0 subunit 6 [Sminthurinus signatus]
MMTNLFSIFDPSSNSLLSLGWISMVLYMLMLKSNFWVISSKLSLVYKNLMSLLSKEFETILGMKNKFLIILLISVFIFIMMNNSMGLLPYVFNSTSHMSITMSMALPIWLGLNLFGWINQLKSMLAHLVPQSTPTALMPFMVLIESTSNIIRPLTLAIRLSANMIAGHLLMTLLGNQFSINALSMIMPIMLVQIMLTTLETAVSIIQAYVFTILTTLYINEIPSN